MEKNREELIQGLERLGITAGEEEVSKLISFSELLLKWNKVYNLTAIRDEGDVIRKHLLDSLTLLPYFKLYGSEVGCRTLDVGCGGGLPAIPLSIFLKDFDFNLIDTVNKKITFVRQAVIQLKLPNVNAFNERVENFHPLKPFNLISCRAFSSLASFVTLTEHLIDENGRWLAMKGKCPVEEIDQLPAGVGVEKVIELKVPFLDTERHLIVLKKNKKLKVRFNFFEEGVTQVSFFVGCGELSQPTRKCKRLMRFQYAFVGTGNCHFISFLRKYIIKDALADGLPIEIQNIILKTQTAGCRIGTCTRIRFYLWCFAPCGRSRKHLCKFCICEINERFNFFLVSIQAFCEYGMH